MTKTPEAQLVEKLDLRIASVEKAIIDQMFASDLKEALAVAEKFKHWDHVREINDERAELQFLKARREQLAAK